MNKWLNKIHHGDCLEIMEQMPEESVDVVITSPPYNIMNSTGNGLKSKTKRWTNCKLQQNEGYDGYADFLSQDEYVAWQRKCLTEMMRLIKPTGAIFYNHKWRVQGGLLQNRKDIIDGFPVRQIIIWHRHGGINFNDSYFLPTFEVIYMIAKPDFKLKSIGQGDVWRIGFAKNNEHPAPFPVELPSRIIKSLDGQIILDPFMGSGTTAIAAIEHNRSYIGIDQSETYVEMARERIKNHTNQKTLMDFI